MSKGMHKKSEDAAVGIEIEKERLRKKYQIHEGDVVRMILSTRRGALESEREEMAAVRVKEIHRYFVTIIRPNGIVESFGWQDFSRRRKD